MDRIDMGHVVDVPFGQVLARVRAELAGVGLHVLYEVDLVGLLRVDHRTDPPRQVLLGVASPGLVQQGLAVEPDLGLLLPWTVAVRELAPGRVQVAALDPELLVTLTGRADLGPVARTTSSALRDASPRSSAARPRRGERHPPAGPGQFGDRDGERRLSRSSGRPSARGSGRGREGPPVLGVGPPVGPPIPSSGGGARRVRRSTLTPSRPHPVPCAGGPTTRRHPDGAASTSAGSTAGAADEPRQTPQVAGGPVARRARRGSHGGRPGRRTRHDRASSAGGGGLHHHAVRPGLHPPADQDRRAPCRDLDAAEPLRHPRRTGPDQIPDRLTSYGLRTVDGSCNNLFAGRETFAAADQVFPRAVPAAFQDADPATAPFGGGQATSYAQTSGVVVDADPR